MFVVLSYFAGVCMFASSTARHYIEVLTACLAAHLRPVGPASLVAALQLTVEVFQLPSDSHMPHAWLVCVSDT
jgi:hypothetical protein